MFYDKHLSFGPSLLTDPIYLKVIRQRLPTDLQNKVNSSEYQLIRRKNAVTASIFQQKEKIV